MAPQFSRNCAQKLRKVQKSAEKFCAPLRIDSWEIWRKFHWSSLRPRMSMCTYVIFFPHVATKRREQLSNFVQVVEKRHGMNKIVRTKSPAGSKFSKTFFEQLYTGWIVVVHLYCGFSLRRQMAPQQSAKFSTAFFGQFRTSLRKDSVANYASIWTLFRCLLEDQMRFVTH